MVLLEIPGLWTDCSGCIQSSGVWAAATRGHDSTYCKLAQLIGNQKELSEDSLPSLKGVVMNSAQAILEASRSSMGMDISPVDLIDIERFSNRVVSMAAYRLELQECLHYKMR
ncbi:hypothetical protein UPYG_G00202830 [Umbra pygmaea]|uniref:Nucleolar protein 5A n=1 Tax=Umbra pygmaea TaxID=75934 RepID=A0ABD0WIM6_UMBPY